MKKHFGIEFNETDKGFTIEFSGDEETIKARKEAVQAWKDFVSKTHKAVKQAHHSHKAAHHAHHGHHAHKGSCCCSEETKSPEENK